MRAAVILAIAIATSGICLGADRDGVTLFYDSMPDALMYMGMTPEDFRIRHDYAEPDVFRLPLIDSLMQDPASLLSRMDSLATMVAAAPSLLGSSSLLWHAMSVEPERSAPRSAARPGIRDIAGRLAHLEPPFDRIIDTYLGSLGKMAGFRDKAVTEVEADLGFLHRAVPRMLAPSPEYEGIDPFELHRLEEAEEALSDSVLVVLENVDMAAVAALSLEALKAARDITGRLEIDPAAMGSHKNYRGRGAGHSGRRFSATGRVLYMGLTPYGPIAIGDTSRTVYEGCFALIIDPGGDDIYNLTNDTRVHFRLIVDCGGDDAYRSHEVAGVGGVIAGTSLILDLEGNDSYRSEGVSLGAGVCGIGAIEDRQGNDSYISGIFSQGAGFLGLGILKDGAGHDTYVAGMQSQAFGYVMGSGFLLEKGGNDTYHTQMSQTDILRYDDHYLTLSQGCAFGSRPDYSGGIGLLLDLQGNDIYSSDIFGQGVAYWFAVGALVDRGGHDRYCSYQYAQGSGVHLAFGLLLDNGGDDGYLSKGVSQGCGHDLSLGLLADLSGNDWYTATDLSQGAGNANGTGIIYDADGNDVYAAKSETNVNGYGNYRREFGSIGLHLDSRGNDYYSARGENASLWESGRYGLGVDGPGDAGNPSGDIVVKEYPLSVRDFTSEELFILSSRGEPRFREWRTYAFDRMVEDTLATIEYLRTVLGTDNARERHTIKDILRKIGEPAIPMLTDAVLDNTARAKSEASWILGLIGSREAFEALFELSRSEDWKLRSSALSAIGKLEDLTDEDMARLELRVGEVLTDAGEVVYVRKDAAYATGKQGLCGVLGLLVDALADPHQAVRFSAAEAIRELSRGTCESIGPGLLAGLPHMDALTTAAALHAAGDLPAEEKIDLAEAVATGWTDTQAQVEVALARLLAGLAPGESADRTRLEALLRKLPEDSWKARAYLGTQ
jgi:HEAT repeat protein